MAKSLAAEQLEKTGKGGSRLSALEVAALGKRLASKQSNPGMEAGTRMDVDYQDEDWKQISAKAKSGGPGSWFASKVDFTLNGTHFLGKVGYSVQGGVVPLFDGAALDVSGAELTAEKPEKAQADSRMGSPASYRNWVTGKNGLLVLAPVGEDNAVPMQTGDIIITEKGLVAEAQKSITFYRDGRSVSAERLEICDQVAVLYGVKVEEGGRDTSDRYQEQAGLNQTGIFLYPLPEAAAEEEVSKMPERAPTKIDQALDVVQNLTADSEPITVGTEAEGGEETGVGLRVDPAKGDVSLSYEKPLTEEGEEGEDPLWTQLLDALKDTASGTAKDAVSEFMKGVANGQFKEGVNGLAKVFTDKWSEIKEIVDGFSDESLRDSWSSFPSQIKDIFIGKISDKEDIKTYFSKLVPTDQIKGFLGMDEEEAEGADSKGDGKISLLTIPLFPGVASFKVELLPHYEFSAYVKGGATNLYDLWKSKEGDTTDLEFRAGVRGSLSLGAAATLELGNAIIKGFGSLTAEAGLKGAVEEEETKVMGSSGENVALELAAHIPVQKAADGSIKQAEAVTASLSAGLLLYGSVGAQVGLESKLLMWQKTLWEKEFFRWDLAAIRGKIGVKKEPVPGLLSGWSLDDAHVAISGPEAGFGAAFLAENTWKRKYGLYGPEEKESPGYENLLSDFGQALALLKKYANVGGNGPEGLIIPGEGDSGPSFVAEEMEKELQDSFVNVWVDAQREAWQVTDQLNQLRGSTKYQREKKSADESKAAHDERISALKQRTPESGDVFDYYIHLKGNPGIGYLDHLEEQAEEEATGYAQIVDYERKRYEEVTKKHTERIAMLQEMIGDNKSEDEIQEAYKKAGGKQVMSHKSVFQNAQALISYEQGRIEEEGIEAQADYDHAVAIESKHKIGKTNLVNETAFFQEYAKSLSQGKLLFYGDPESLLDYEKKRFEKLVPSKSKQNLQDMNAIEGQMGMLQEGEDSSRQLNQFRNSKKKKEDGTKVPNLSEIFGKDLYRTASVDDLIDLEMETYVKGETGQILEKYLQESQGQASPSSLEEVFGEKEEEAGERLGAFLDKSDAQALIPYLTIELLLEYAKLRRQNAKDKAQADREYWYLYLGQRKVEAAKPQDARKVEEEYIADYFRTFSSTEQIYKEALKDGNQINLPLMMAAFSDDSENARMAELKKAREDGLPDYQVLQKYLELGGEEEEITKHQQEKEEGGQMRLEDAHRYYVSSIAEDTSTHGTRKKISGLTHGLVQEKTGHYQRYTQLKELFEQGTSYEGMLEQYKAMGGGKRYAEKVKGNLAKGIAWGRSISVKDVLNMEQEQKNKLLERHTSRRDMVAQMQEEGKDYQEILSAYEDKVHSDGTGLVGQLKNKVNATGLYTFSTGFEKSLRDTPVSSAQLLEYEERRKKEVGQSHAERLRFLLGLPEDSEDFMTAALADESKQEEKRAEYLTRAKRFKNSSQVKEDKASRVNELLNRPDSEMEGSILSYEEGRSQFYEQRQQELAKREQSLVDMQEKMEKMIALCHQVTNNLKDIREHPGTIWDKISEFEESVKFVQERDQRRQELQEQQKAAQAVRAEVEQWRQEESL